MHEHVRVKYGRVTAVGCVVRLFFLKFVYFFKGEKGDLQDR